MAQAVFKSCTLVDGCVTKTPGLTNRFTFRTGVGLPVISASGVCETIRHAGGRAGTGYAWRIKCARLIVPDPTTITAHWWDEGRTVWWRKSICPAGQRR